MTEPDLKVRVPIPENVEEPVDPVEKSADPAKDPDGVKVPPKAKDKGAAPDAAVIINVNR